MINRHTAAALAAGLAFAATANANLLSNASFEMPVTFDGAPFVGSWEAFSGGASAGSGNSAANPRTGMMNLELGFDNSDNSFAGAFQDVTGFSEGQEITFSGWHAAGSAVQDFGIEIRIEWRDSVNNVEVGRTMNFSDQRPSGTDYEQWSISALVPAGADSGRFVYAIQTFGGEPGPTNTGILYLDDLSVVPAPASAALLGLAGFGMTRRRR